MPVNRKICGTVNLAASSAPAITELAIMNSALRILFAAMMRARCVGWLRNWISAYMGTLYRPANRLSSSRSPITRQCAATFKNSAALSGDETSCSPREAKYRSMANTLMPMAPSGTRPIST